MLPVGIGPSDMAQAVTTVVVFNGLSVRDGIAAAGALAAKLRSVDLATYFPDYPFGSVHMETVSAPFLVRGAARQPAVCPFLACRAGWPTGGALLSQHRAAAPLRCTVAVAPLPCAG